MIQKRNNTYDTKKGIAHMIQKRNSIYDTKTWNNTYDTKKE